mgnify:CR=1 FL=1|jgi:hypothetical protein|tara:strand:+ start:1296 stop:1592 length:297 start_codon:yes stop_codon:yes gene_type:complete
MANVIKGATDTLTSAGTAEALDATGPTNITSVTIKADDDNTSPIYIGDLNVSSSAARFRLNPGEAVSVTDTDGIDMSKLFYDGGTNGDRVDVIYSTAA